MPRQSIPLLLCAALAGACAGRSGPVTRPGAPTKFDPAGSDPQAIALADQVIKAVGGEASWVNAKQIVWNQGYVRNGKVEDAVKHAWDRWNGRHQLTQVDQRGTAGVAAYALFDDKADKYTYIVQPDGKRMEGQEEQAGPMVALAKKRWAADSYFLALPHRLKDPGTRLKYLGEKPPPGTTAESAKKNFEVIAVTAEPSPGGILAEGYELYVSKETRLPEYVVISKGETDAGQRQLISFQLSGWTDVGGLKFATVWDNLGMLSQEGATKTKLEAKPRLAAMKIPPMEVTTPGEQFVFANIEISGDVDDLLFIRPPTPPKGTEGPAKPTY